MKVDYSALMQEIDKCLKREEFFEMMDTQPMSTPRSRKFASIPKVKKQSSGNVGTITAVLNSARRQKADVQKPTTLVPARNSKMLGVNEKYLIGDDGKTYLKESLRISDRTYREPPITGDRSSRVSYYDRSKVSMDVEGFDAVLDFQPFVPADSSKR